MATEVLHRRDVHKGEHAKAAYAELSDQKFGNRVAFIFANGRRRSLAYTGLVETDENPDVGGLVLDFVGTRVTLYGRNLQELTLRFEEEVIGEVFERHDYHGLRVAEDEPYVERIDWEKT